MKFMLLIYNHNLQDLLTDTDYLIDNTAAV